MKALDKRWSIPIRLTSSANKSMKEPGRRRVPKEALTRPASTTSPHTLMDFGKAGGVQKDHLKEIGFKP